MQENNTADQALVDNEYKAEMDRALEGKPGKLSAAEAIAKYAGRKNEFRDQADIIKAGTYVPMVILVVKNGQEIMNYHLPQKLFALKDFSQADTLLEYGFEHPFQMPMLNPQNPDPAAFNCAAANFHKWLVKKGYCEVQGATDVIVQVWSDEEIKAAQAEEKIKREAEAAAINHIDEIAFTQDPVVGSIGSDPQHDPKIGRGLVTPAISFAVEGDKGE